MSTANISEVHKNPFEDGPNLETAELEVSDQQWLSLYGISEAWQSDPKLRSELDKIVSVGSSKSYSFRGSTLPQEVKDARHAFYGILGLEKIVRRCEPDLTPTNTFICAQRKMVEHGLNPSIAIEKSPYFFTYSADHIEQKVQLLKAHELDVAKIAKEQPSILGLSEEATNCRVADLTGRGLDTVKVINAHPPVLGYKPQAIDEKFATFIEAGLDPVGIINRLPEAIGVSPLSLKTKLVGLNSAGLDARRVATRNPSALTTSLPVLLNKIQAIEDLGLPAAKIFNAQPALLGLSPERYTVRMQVLKEMGLDPKRVITMQPNILGYNEQTIHDKMKFVAASCSILNWRHSPQELVNYYPAVLCFDKRKLRLLRRIAAGLSSDEEVGVGRVAHFLKVPVENYLITLDETNATGHNQLSIDDIYLRSYKLKYDAAERRERAVAIAQRGDLGRIASSYLSYRPVKNQE